MAIVKMMIAKKKKDEIEIKKMMGPRWRRSKVARRSKIPLSLSSPLKAGKEPSPSTAPPSAPCYKYVAGDPSSSSSTRRSRFSPAMKASSPPRSPPPPGFSLPIYHPISSSALYYDYSSPSPSFLTYSPSSQRSVNSKFYYDRPLVPIPFSLSSSPPPSPSPSSSSLFSCFPRAGLDSGPATPPHAPDCIKA